MADLFSAWSSSGHKALLKFCAVFTLIKTTCGLRCGYTTCNSVNDYCCVSNQYSVHPTCCSALHTDWALKGTGIGFGITVALIVFIAFCSCFKKFRRDGGLTRRSGQRYSDQPPDYNSVKVSMEEPPPYYKLYPIPGGPPSGETTTPQGDATECPASTSGSCSSVESTSNRTNANNPQVESPELPVYDEVVAVT